MLYLILLAISALVGHLLWRRYKTFQILWEAGHVGPRGNNYISGSYFDVLREGQHVIFERWFKEYKSDVVGYYHGSHPCLAIKDLDIAKQVLIKDFDKFRNRVQALRLEASHPYLQKHLIFAGDQRWKSVRNFMTPSFSTVNLRVMFDRLSSCVDKFMDNCTTQGGESFNVYTVVRRLTLDNISRGAFSINSGVQNDAFGPRPKYQQAAEDAIDKLGSHWLSGVTQSAKPLGRFLFRHLRALGFIEHHQDPMLELLKQIVKLRETERKETDWVDFMQNLVNGGTGESMAKRTFHKELGFKLSHEEVIANSLLFITAAFEQVSSGSSLLLYALGKDPEMQTKLRESLRKGLNEQEEPREGLSYDFIMNHRYLDMVVSEGMRLYPTANGFLGREALEDVEYKGVKIPKGTGVLFPAFSIHRDPRNFPDPEKFDPERFSPENKGSIPSMAYLPFGEGQRSCIGNRFALMQMKLTLAAVVLRFDIELDTTKHKGPMEFVDRASVLFQPKGGVHLKLKTIH